MSEKIHEAAWSGNRLCFTIDEPGQPKARPRVTRGGQRTFVPAPYVSYKRRVADAAMAAAALSSWDAMRPSYALFAVFWMPTRRRVDCDNLLGGLLDALNGILYEDDAMVVHAQVTKLYDKARPRVEVGLEPFTGFAATRLPIDDSLLEECLGR